MLSVNARITTFYRLIPARLKGGLFDNPVEDYLFPAYEYPCPVHDHSQIYFYLAR